MLSRAARALSRRAVARAGPVRFLASTPEEPKNGAFSDFSPSGFDRTDPMHAPSPFEEWKEAGYDNVADKDWKHWEGIEDEHLKHFQVRLDPEDIKQRGAFWNLFTNYKTAFPAIVVIGFPLIGQGHIHMDWHVEAAAIFWTVLFGISSAASGSIFTAMSQGPEAKKAEVKAAEAAFEEEIKATILAHERAIALPDVMDTLNSALADLHDQEARAATIRVKNTHRNKMVDMLDFLVATSAKSEEGRDLVVAATIDAVETKLATDAKFASKVADEAIEAFVSGTDSTSSLTSEFTSQLKAFESNPPTDPNVDPAAEEAKARDLFVKRFGYSDSIVTESMMKKASESAEEMAYLTARCGGQAPTVGAPIKERMPIDF